jgi:hypothetical protein
MLKSGISALRLLNIGAVLSHLYKCIDIAMECHCACLPFFSNRVYEGCILTGGLGASFSINGEMVSFESMADLKYEFANSSTHATALAKIRDIFSAAGDSGRETVMNTHSMFELGKICGTADMNQDMKNAIIAEAVNLNYGDQSWVVSPARLAQCFSLMKNLTLLDSTYPIGRLALFSQDPVRIALSCFGETSCPSWDIPNGTSVSLSSPTPPTPPNDNNRGKSKGATVSDAKWVMPVRLTDLVSAEGEFRKMCKDCAYRSVPTVEAKKRGYRVFSRDRMGVFWNEMRAVVLVINPGAEQAEVPRPEKRRAVDSGEGPAGSAPKRAKVLDF